MLWYKNVQTLSHDWLYLGKDRHNATQMLTDTHAVEKLRSLTRRVEGVGHKLYLDFSSPHLLDHLHTRGINCCGTVRQA